jgi:hypothetical protein
MKDFNATPLSNANSKASQAGVKLGDTTPNKIAANDSIRVDEHGRLIGNLYGFKSRFKANHAIIPPSRFDYKR